MALETRPVPGLSTTAPPVEASGRRAAPTWAALVARWGWLLEIMVLLIVAYVYAAPTLLNFTPTALQQTGEHNESATLPLLAEIGLLRHGEVPLWNPYMLTGLPHVGDPLAHFWHPVSTLPILIWGGVDGMKVSVFLAFVLAGLGQWLFATVFAVRGVVRLWAAIMFMLSGGLALLWRVGWYELLLGIAWFPWCFAAFWWALRRRDFVSLALAALTVAMVISTGGGYYPFYLGASLLVLGATSWALGPAGTRWRQVGRAAAIALIAIGVLAVMLVPMLDGYFLTRKQAPPDVAQTGSQPIPYGLLNYVISTPQWLGATILGTHGGWNWFYIGWLPLAGAALSPMALRVRRYRPYVIAAGVLTLFLLAWFANQYTPFKYLYEWFPFFKQLRFPNRLLIVATSPLLILAGLGLQYLADYLRRWDRAFPLTLSLNAPGRSTGWSIGVGVIGSILFALVLFLGVRDVYQTNQGMAFAEGRIDPKALDTLAWLKAYDPSLYYINAGGGAPLYQWTAATFMAEMPMINFEYGRLLTARDEQRKPESPFVATPKYMIARPDDGARPQNATLLRELGGLNLWQIPDALPYAFAVSDTLVQSRAKLTPANVQALSANLDGPNRVVVAGAAPPGSTVVALMNDYPGWRVTVDGQAAALTAVNGYLGVAALPGEHSYVFEFRPTKYYVGLVISLVCLLAIGILIGVAMWRRVRSTPRFANTPGAEYVNARSS